MTLPTGRNGALTAAACARRRARLRRALGETVAIIATAPVRYWSRDVEVPFRADSDFLYLTGFDEPEAVAILAPPRLGPPYRLFVRPRDPARALWDGPRAGLEGAAAGFGAEEARAIGDLEDVLTDLFRRVRRVRLSSGGDPAVESLVERVAAAAARARPRSARHRRGTLHLEPLAPLVHDMRLVKDRDEIRALRASARIGCAGHRAGLGVIGPGRRERDVQAEIEAEFRRRGARGPAYPSIVGGGPNACVLHHRAGDRIMRSGELVLIDAGCEAGGYASDITRTVPVGGRYSAPQRRAYEVVLEAQRRAIAAVRPGASFDAPHRAASLVLAHGMVRLGLLSGDPARLVAEGTVRRYFPHRTSHWLGLDVHDVGAAMVDGRARRLRAGMVLTVEPGLYVPPDDASAPALLRGLGIRIEDDVLVTPTGRSVLTAAAPKEPALIERLMRTSSARPHARVSRRIARP